MSCLDDFETSRVEKSMIVFGLKSFISVETSVVSVTVLCSAKTVLGWTVSENLWLVVASWNSSVVDISVVSGIWYVVIVWTSVVVSVGFSL